MNCFNATKFYPFLYDYYEVEKIISRKLVGKNKFYLIKWLGYPIQDCTWEPISHLDKINTLVENFDKDFPFSIDKRLLQKYLRTIHKKNNRRLKKISKSNQEKCRANENSQISHIIINLEDSKNLSETINEDKKEVLKSDEIGEEEILENNVSDDCNDSNCIKLIKPIIIW